MTTTKTTDNTIPGTDIEPAKPVGVLAAFADDEWAGVDDGLVGMEHIGYSMPRLAGDMRPGGGWTDEVTGEKVDHLAVVFLAMRPTRAYWKEPFGKGSIAPDCRSADMVKPDPSSPEPQSTTCAACPHSKWVDNRQACGSSIQALVYDTEANHLARVSFGRTGIKRVRTFLSGLKANVPPRPPVSVVADIKLEEVDQDGMRWLEPVLTVRESVSRAEATPLLALRDQVVAQWNSALAEDLASPDADASVAAGPFDGAVEATAKTVYVDGEEPF